MSIFQNGWDNPTGLQINEFTTFMPELTDLCNSLNQNFITTHATRLYLQNPVPILVFRTDTDRTKIPKDGYGWIGNNIVLKRNSPDPLVEFHHERGHSLLWNHGRIAENLRLANFRSLVGPYEDSKFKDLCRSIVPFLTPNRHPDNPIDIKELATDFLRHEFENGFVRRDTVNEAAKTPEILEDLLIAEDGVPKGVSEITSRTVCLSEGFAKWFEAKMIEQERGLAVRDSLSNSYAKNPHKRRWYIVGSLLMFLVENHLGEDEAVTLAMSSMNDAEFVRNVRNLLNSINSQFATDIVNYYNEVNDRTQPLQAHKVADRAIDFLCNMS